MAEILVNAVGQKCPVPVVMTQKALKNITEESVLEVRVDNEVAVQNLLRLAAGNNIEAKSVKETDDLYVVTMIVTGPQEAEVLTEDCVDCSADKSKGVIAVISSDRMGEGNDELGKVLIKGFIYALSQLENLPEKIIFYNGGATIPVEGSPCLEDLKNMEKAGVEILTCGTCLDYYNLKEKLAAGTVTNMYTIVEAMAGAGRILKP